MSARGGRGGGGRGGSRKLGIDIDPELDSVAESAPSETFPPVQQPIAELPTGEEKDIVEHYRLLRKRVHHGDFYTIIDDSARIKKTASGKQIHEPVTAHFDPFEDQPTYAKRFKRKHNTLPKLSRRHFELEFFPRELWPLIQCDSTTPKNKPPSKTSTSSTPLTASNHRPRSKLDRMFDDLEAKDHAAQAAEAADHDKQHNRNNNEHGDDDDGDGLPPKEDDEEDEDRDRDQFSDDDDENDDYNAESYFNNGGEDDDADLGADYDEGGGNEY